MRHKGGTETAPASSAEKGPFTAEELHALLCLEVLKGDTAKVPPVTELSEPARVLTDWWWLVRMERGPWWDEAQRRQKLANALTTLKEVLTPLRSELVFESERHENVCESLTASVHALDVLAQGVHLVGKSAELMRPTIPLEDRWKYYAQRLVELFHATVAPSNPRTQLKAASFRFIVCVAPRLTGETPTVEAVRTHLNRDRPVKRANRPL